MMAIVDIELLVVPDCPNQAPAATLLRAVLDDLDLAGQPVRTSIIASAAEAKLRGFLGSPTFLVDGVDLFADPDRQPALACRMYQTQAGRAGLPELATLRRALSRVAVAGAADRG